MTEPADLLTQFVLGLLTPFLLASSITDPELARRAAVETIAAYKAEGQDQLVSIAQIVAFALTALDNLRLSLPNDMSLSMKLRLRGNANALNKASRNATTTLEAQRKHPPEPKPQPEATTAAPEPSQSIHQSQPQQPSALDQSWAQAMTQVAAEFTAELPNMPAAERKAQLARIGALSNVATMLGKGEAPSLKARLLGTTAIRT